MAKVKISEFSSTPGNNTDIDGINLAEGCAPSGINDAIRELMAQLKDFQAGTAGDSFNGPVGTSTAAAGAFTTLSSTGNTTLGDASGDSVTINGATTFVNVSPTITPGTANGVAYLNGSKVLTTGSALTFDGTELVSNTGVRANSFMEIRNNAASLYWENGANTLYWVQQLAGSDFRWQYFNGSSVSEQMRLTSTGLGIGTSSPSYKLDVQKGSDGTIGYFRRTGATINPALTIYSNETGNTVGFGTDYAGATSPAITFSIAASEKLRLDTSGNLGLGVTPSAWRSGALSYDVARSSYADENGTLTIASNAYRATSNWLYKVSTFATRMDSDSGQFRWYTAPSGTAGNAISFTQAMTLDASGNLGIGTTSPGARLHASQTSGGGSVVGAYLQNPDNNTNTEVRLAFGPNDAALALNRYAWIGAINTGSVNATALTFATGPGGTAATERARITSGGEVYIAGTTDQGAYNLQVNGTGVWGAGAYVNGSDRNLKNNIQSLDLCLDVVMAMRPVTFQYKPEHSKDQSVQPGFIAQELQEAMAGKTYIDGVIQAGPEYLNVAYQNIIPILVKSIQELKAEFDAYKATHP